MVDGRRPGRSGSRPARKQERVEPRREGRPRLVLLPAPAGEDEARTRHPKCFVGLPAAAPAAPGAASTKPISPAEYPSEVGLTPEEQTEADHVAFWINVIRGGDWPADVADLAVAAVEARGRRLAADALVQLAACDGWAGLAAPYRAVLRTVFTEGASSKQPKTKAGRYCWVYPGIANATIGSTRTDGTGWRQPDPPAVDDDTPPWAPVSNVGASAVVWPAVASGLAFKGRMALISGKAKQGKSTTVGAAAAAVADGADWLTGEKAPAGTVIWIVRRR